MWQRDSCPGILTGDATTWYWQVMRKRDFCPGIPTGDVITWFLSRDTDRRCDNVIPVQGYWQVMWQRDSCPEILTVYVTMWFLSRTADWWCDNVIPVQGCWWWCDDVVTVQGGMKAVLWTDCFQVGMMLAGYVAILIQGSIEVGGFSAAWDIMDKSGRVIFDEFVFFCQPLLSFSISCFSFSISICLCLYLCLSLSLSVFYSVLDPLPPPPKQTNKNASILWCLWFVQGFVLDECINLPDFGKYNWVWSRKDYLANFQLSVLSCRGVFNPLPPFFFFYWFFLKSILY